MKNIYIVKFFKEEKKSVPGTGEVLEIEEDIRNLLLFCKTPRTRKEICEYLGLTSVTYTIQTHVMPLVEKGLMKLSIPDKPKSSKQLYYSDI